MTTRRDVLIGSAAAGAGAALTLPAPPAFARLAAGGDIASTARAFLAGLPPAQRTAASFPWNGPQWKRWDYYGASGYVKPGLRLEQMAAADKARAWDMFARLLSPEGITKAERVMLLQDVLMSEGDGVGERHRERFSVSVHGTPAEQGAWGLRLEGHHLSLSFAFRDGQVVSVTPAAFAARPARITKGPHVGLNTLDAEERLARRLMADLSPALQTRARVRPNKLFNILSSAGQERANTTKLGLAAADMTAAQRELMAELVDVYAVAPYRGAIATAQQARVRGGDRAAIHFAWYGPNEAERGFGYRIIADTFVIEMGSIDDAGQHLHPIYHDLGNVLGSSA